MKILIIRFSSFGDVLQTLSVAGRLAEAYPSSEIHWVTRAEFEPLIRSHPRVSRVWSLAKGADWRSLRTLGCELRAQNFTHIYDVHNNLRSRLLCWQLNGFAAWRVWSGRQRFLRRPIYRWKRFLLFRFHRNYFPKPFSGQNALLHPLARWGLSTEAPPVPQLFLDRRQIEKVCSAFAGREFVALAASAAFPLKRWPLEYWKELIELCADTVFVLLGGPEDTFLGELEAIDPRRVVNMAGKLSLLESAQVVAGAAALVANDTGLMHVAEQIGKPCLALMGPAPFGFPSRARTRIFEVELSCRPCSKHGQGPCVNSEYQKCLRDISPRTIANSLRSILHAALDAPLS